MKTCIKCGGNEFYSKGDCKICARSRASAYRAANPEKAKAVVELWKANNPEQLKAGKLAHYKANRESILAGFAERYRNSPDAARARTLQWRLDHAERVKEYYSEWVKNNPEKIRIVMQNRRARKLLSGGKLSSGLAKRLFKLQRGKCACCSLPLGSNYHLDHKMPLALGGSNTDDNIQLLRQRCNSQKGKKHPIDFMQSRGFLL